MRETGRKIPVPVECGIIIAASSDPCLDDYSFIHHRRLGAFTPYLHSDNCTSHSILVLSLFGVLRERSIGISIPFFASGGNAKALAILLSELQHLVRPLPDIWEPELMFISSV